MRILSRAVFREIFSSALLGTILFTFVLFLQKLGSGKQFEILVRGSASPSVVAYLVSLLLPPALIFALPIGTLVGVLIGLGRMAADGEIIAMRAAGVSSRRVAAPVLAFALCATAMAAACSLWLTPLSIRETYRVLNTVIAQQLTAEIQPRVFEEQFTNTNTILYVGDVIPSATSVVRWRNVFIADLTPAEQRSSQGRQFGDAPRITVASEAYAIPDAASNSIQLSMTGVSTHEVDANPEIYYNTATPKGDQRLAAKTRGEATVQPHLRMDTRELFPEAAKNTEASIELHRRFALPLACLLLAVVGIPLGVSSRKSGKSGAFVVTVFLAFLYWMAMGSLIRLAQQGKLSAPLAVWLPNIVFTIAGIVLLAGLEQPGDRDLLSRLKQLGLDAMAWLRPKLPARAAPGSAFAGLLPRIPLLPGTVDTYVLTSFLFYLAALLASFVFMAHVFIFFELLGDIFARGIPMSRVLTYHVNLTPKLIYDSAPMSVLVAVLVCFGVLAKNNEITAMKACGVSLYRLSLPIVVVSLLLSAGLFAFDHYYIPEANRVQEAILNEIKGRPVQTYLRPDRKWIFGQGSSRIYYYKYLDPDNDLMVGVHVYDLDPDSFRLRRHISAETARWEPGLKNWIFQNGWSRQFQGVATREYKPFDATTFPGLNDPPTWFLREMKQEKQLNFAELDRYISELQQSGFDTIRLRVQFHKKFSVPVFVAIMALLSIPFSFLTGNRGAMAGVGVSFGIAIAYWAVSKLFEEFGNVNQLPAVMAAWSPDALFSMAGMYLFTRMRS
jgi:LPS export ABC transporter permease LptG/LPS export ABC transporter permease LptF